MSESRKQPLSHPAQKRCPPEMKDRAIRLARETIAETGESRNGAEVERATAEWVAWWNNGRLHGSCGRMTPAEYEAAWCQRQAAAA